jgi:hypothetical protein
MANNRKETEKSPQADMFPDSIQSVGVAVENTFEPHLRAHVQDLLRMLAPNAEAYAFMLSVFPHINRKVRAVLEAYPGLLPNAFADIYELTAAIAKNLKLFDAGSASLLDSINSEPDTEGRAHHGARGEHDLSVVLWDSASPGNQSVSDAFGGLLILAISAATPGGTKRENNIARAASCFRRALGTGRGTAKLAGNVLQRIDRILKSCIGLVDLHDALIDLRQDFPAEEGIAALVRGMALIIEMLPKFAESNLTNAEKGDVRLPRLLMRLTKQNGIDTRALDKALYEQGSILSEQAEHRQRNEGQEVDLYAAFAVNPVIPPFIAAIKSRPYAA